jgi:hypothetical protein
MTILGIRHHGVGSARYVLERLEQLQPDLVLVEGPPELDAVLYWVGDPDLKPPVAALCYDENDPQHAVFFPFSEFSPEWQAIAWANRRRVPVRMMDLPVALNWQIERQPPEAPAQEADREPPGDPIAHFSQLAGYDDSESWWEHQFEQKYLPGGAETHFEAVLLMMKTLREAGVSTHLDTLNVYREAWMAQRLRQAQNDMYSNIVVVCGAWHAPALLDLPGTEKAHRAVLKSLPKSKIKVGATWIPWTNDRLSYESGYGAGIVSPGWYRHRWKHPADTGARWLAKVAQLFRKRKMDISTAHVIEALRLAESLAALRGRARAGLQEFNEAVVTVMCMGDQVLLDFVRRDLIIGHALGRIPDQLPKLPLQADFEEKIRQLRLKTSEEDKLLELDLRQDLDLRRSVFLHRLRVLGIPWADIGQARSKGTFRENWQLRWRPEMMVALLEKGIWGNTVALAAEKWLCHRAEGALSVADLSAMMSDAIPAELFRAVEVLLERINNMATLSAEVAELMAAVVPLADLGRYGNVRQSDLEAVGMLVEGLLIRVSIGLPPACFGLDDDSAQQLFVRIRQVNDAVRTLEQPSISDMWFQALHQVVQKDGAAPILRGCTTRLLYDARQLEHEAVAREYSLALSTANEAGFSAGWLEGFLKGSGMILLYDDTLWRLLYTWVAELDAGAFVQLLPILRRTFAQFDPAERRQLGQKARKGGAESTDTASETHTELDAALAAQALADTLAWLLPADTLNPISAHD